MYYDELSGTLNKFDAALPLPSFDEFYQQIIDRGIHGGMFALFSVTMRLYEDVQDSSVIMRFFKRDEREFRAQLMQRDETRILLGNLLKYFDKMGFLDEQ